MSSTLCMDIKPLTVERNTPVGRIETQYADFALEISRERAVFVDLATYGGHIYMYICTYCKSKSTCHAMPRLHELNVNVNAKAVCTPGQKNSS
ncbi:hypothetical protein QQF64_012901 [Cirrhinus molitorella]|uniref:Uncharacterized protein n=1 Tax=Cirrhinus molitorella TaxID=172907 RepID=A0ABR3LPL4_9TELE